MLNKSSNKKIILITLSLCLAVGVIIGCGFAAALHFAEFSILTGALDSYVGSFDSANPLKTEIFKGGLIKHGRTIFALWLLGFIEVGIIFSLGIVVIYGISLGFAAGILVEHYGYVGIVYAFFIYVLPQMLFFVPASFFTVYSSLRFSLDSKKQPERVKNFNFYLLTLLVASASITLLSFFEAYFVPFFINTFLA